MGGIGLGDDHQQIALCAIEIEVFEPLRAGLASTARRESTRIVEVLVRQLGELLLAPMIDAVWERVAEPRDADKPRLSITGKDYTAERRVSTQMIHHFLNTASDVLFGCGSRAAP
ncbi:hypothetical protein [Nocardia sp. CA-119907]|uniref:hypothetical protein n=1 Tax=Nocardia sp. CA-119907 TaxID=3239973 RepID=UPI003D952CFD